MLTDRVARVVQRTLMAHFGIYTVVTTFIDIIWLILGKYSSLSLQIATIAFNGLCLIYVFILYVLSTPTHRSRRPDPPPTLAAHSPAGVSPPLLT